VSSGPTAADAVAYLSTPEAIRERAAAVLAAGLAGRLAHFAIDLSRLTAAADLVATITRERYPSLKVPVHSRWRHFDVGGHGRLAELDCALDRLSLDDRARAKVDLAVVSVLLDAGAGPGWRYLEAETQQPYARSEGLAVASFRMFLSGFFSANAAMPTRVDAAALATITDERLGAALQVSADRPLAGLSGRAELLRRLGSALRRAPELFGARDPRPGHLLDALREKSERGRVEAAEILRAVLTGFGAIWPGRLALAGVDLGDVWPHPAAGGTGAGGGLVPLHKLSQWMTYSLIEPLTEAGSIVGGLDRLTGLAEYRNGGLLLDTGVLEPRHRSVVSDVHRPGDEVVVEWRALTVALLDRLAPLVRERLAAYDLPLAAILEGGTWIAGRRLADARRGGAPPILIESDGTVM